MLCQRQREYYDSSKNGQHHCNSLHQQTGWNSVPRTELPDQGPEGQNRLEALPRSLCPNQMFGPLKVNLFASRLTHKLPNYVSWRPDPGAMTCDAFAQDWSQIKGAHANPPWNMIGKVLYQVYRQHSQLVLIVPAWKYNPGTHYFWKW